MITKNSLGIFWKFKDGFEEVSGLYFYGFWEKEIPQNVCFNGIKDLWKFGTVEYKLTKFEEAYNVISLQILIKDFPDSEVWLETIKSILQNFVIKGAKVAWCGGEDCSPNPIIFNPKLASGNIYACFTEKVGFMCNANLNQEIQYLDDTQLNTINILLQSKK